MTGLVFLHGWGYGPDSWEALAGAFGPAPVLRLDAGYCGQPALEIPANPGGWLGVGHSLGFARLLEMDIPWRGLVGISAFLRFCQRPGKDTGTPTDMLDAMLARLDEAPQEVLSRFHKRCCHRVTPLPAFPPEGLARLRDDLLSLREIDLPAPRRAVPIRLLHAADDRIVPLDLAREAQALLPGSRLKTLETGGHALPMTRPADCLRLIQELLRDLA